MERVYPQVLLGPEFDLPPLVFTMDEARALVASVRMAQDHCMPAQQTTMPRGAVHCVEVPTWLEIVAQSDADVVVTVLRGVSLGRELRVWLDAVLERLGVRRKGRRVGLAP